MFKFLVLSALVACVYAVQSPCPGCPFEDNSNSDDVLPQLKLAIKAAGLNEEVKSIEKVTKQVTGGMLFDVKFSSKSGKECEATWLFAPWQSKNPLDAKASCQ